MQDSRAGEHNGRPDPLGSRRGAGNVEKTGKKPTKATATDKEAQASRSSRPVPASSTASAGLRSDRAGVPPEPLFVVRAIVARWAEAAAKGT